MGGVGDVDRLSLSDTRPPHPTPSQVCDALEDIMTAGANIVDHHGCDFFPERWFDLVVVLQADNTILWERLEKRWVPIVVVVNKAGTHGGVDYLQILFGTVIRVATVIPLPAPPSFCLIAGSTG